MKEGNAGIIDLISQFLYRTISKIKKRGGKTMFEKMQPKRFLNSEHL